MGSLSCRLSCRPPALYVLFFKVEVIVPARNEAADFDPSEKKVPQDDENR